MLIAAGRLVSLECSTARKSWVTRRVFGDIWKLATLMTDPSVICDYLAARLLYSLANPIHADGLTDIVRFEPVNMFEKPQRLGSRLVPALMARSLIISLDSSGKGRQITKTLHIG
ncbi:hypothetical protein FVEN_g12612 [Fusarium venenatum]|nr:hypothetical protein FVEN_g12612 [Fusarium venenatum]